MSSRQAQRASRCRAHRYVRFPVRRLALVAAAALASLLSSAPASRVAHAASADGPGMAGFDQPFGPAPVTLTSGPLADKWRGLAARAQTDSTQIAACHDDVEACSPRTLQFMIMADDFRGSYGLARLGEVNRAVNLGIRFASDASRHGRDDVWSAPLETLATGEGDCEDYAILKLALLRAIGVAEQDLRLVIVRNHARREDHAVAAVRFDGGWRILDNQRFVVLEDWQLQGYQGAYQGGYRAAFVMDADGVHAFSDPNVAMREHVAPAAESRS